MAHEDPPLKISSLMFGSLKHIGGFQVFTYNLLKRLARRGHRVDFYVTYGEYNANEAFYRNLSFSVKPLIPKAYALARHAPKALGAYLLYRQFKGGYDAWQIVGAYPAGFVASSLAGRVPLILRTHGEDIQKDADLNYGLRLDPRLEQQIRKTCHKMDRVVAMNESMSESYRELGVPESKIVEIPNGVDIDLLKAPVDRRKIRLQQGLPMDKPLLLTVGRYHPKKGYDVIPSIAGRLKASGVSFLWLIVGDQTDRLKPLIDQADVANEVRTVGEIGAAEAFEHGELQLPDQALIDLYQCADIFVFPSHLEGFPRVIIEAMAAGLPVVTTDAPGCRDVVTQGKTGLLANPDDAEGLAAHVQDLIDNETLRGRLVTNGYQHIGQYNWDVVVDRYEAVYRSCADS